MYIKSKIVKENLLGYGSNRIVFDLNDGTVVKIPYNNIGIECNKLEYENYNKKPDIVAKIYKYENNLIIQEKLNNTTVVPYIHTINGTVKQYLKENGIDIDESLIKEMLNTKAQVGTDSEGRLKFFDYEDAKLRHTYTEKPFKMNEETLPKFWDYVCEKDVENIMKNETFEEYRKSK